MTKPKFLLVIYAACFASVCLGAVPPAGNFDLSHWKLTLPINADGGTTGKAVEVKQPQLQTYTSEFFYTGTDGAMVFWCPVLGATTSGATEPRSELRELLDPTDSSVNWSAYGTHILRGQCRVTQQPDTGDVIIGQVHGYPSQRLVKVQYGSGRVLVYIRKSLTVSGDAKFTYTVGSDVLINYEIKVVDGVAFVTVNGVTNSHNFGASDPSWLTDSTFYFKAGAYLQDHDGPITEGGRVSFYQLSFSHGTTPPPLTAPTISSQPVSRNVNEGSLSSFSVTAAGSPTLGYQWRKNGANVSGATANTLTFSNVRTNDGGNYSVVVANSAGSVTSVVATLTVTATNVVTLPPTTIVALGEALDATAFVWTTNGSPGWFGQTNVTQDGSDAAQSGAISHEKTTSMQTTVQGPGAVSFWWKVSSEPSNDRLLFYINGSEKARISGAVDWQWRTFTISSGAQTLKWTYSKNSSRTGGLDRAWVDQVKVGAVAPTIATQPANSVIDPGKTASFSVAASGTALTYRWLFNGSPLTEGGDISGATTSKLNIANVQSPRVGTYSVIVSNSAGLVTSAGATLSLNS
ncbi:MAG TPA: polysaccharide lyase family 7 protein, partial [Candidatus Acidoferrum sp.]|nr:polysaccharide lyase family 7 protein [Candidatus Acidoferrum sp.]